MYTVQPTDPLLELHVVVLLRFVRFFFVRNRPVTMGTAPDPPSISTLFKKSTYRPSWTFHEHSPPSLMLLETFLMRRITIRTYTFPSKPPCQTA